MPWCCSKPERNGVDGGDVGADVVSFSPVSPGGGPQQLPISVKKGDTDAVYLRFYHVVEFSSIPGSQVSHHPLMEFPEFFDGVTVVEAQHGYLVLDCLEALHGSTANTLRW